MRLKPQHENRLTENLSSCQFRLKLFTLDQTLVLKTVGHLSSKDVKSVQAALTEFIDVG